MAAKILDKNIDAVRTCDIEEFELVMFMDFPSSIEDYVAILTKIHVILCLGCCTNFSVEQMPHWLNI